MRIGKFFIWFSLFIENNIRMHILQKIQFFYWELCKYTTFPANLDVFYRAIGTFFSRYNLSIEICVNIQLFQYISSLFLRNNKIAYSSEDLDFVIEKYINMKFYRLIQLFYWKIYKYSTFSIHLVFSPVK